VKSGISRLAVNRPRFVVQSVIIYGEVYQQEHNEQKVKVRMETGENGIFFSIFFKIRCCRGQEMRTANNQLSGAHGDL
jgi:hypothetical protein